MKGSVKAFAPANISAIFKIHEDPDTKKMGSLGLGFTVNKGVTAEVIPADKTECFFNRKKIHFPTIESVIAKLIPQGKVRIMFFSDLPLGSGFGLSGASALASAYALNSLFHLKRKKKDLAQVAHIAEVENHTGLGDVINQYFGGFLLKRKPSAEFIVEKITLPNSLIYYKCISKLSTADVITDPKRKKIINVAATEALQEIDNLMQNKGKITLAELIALSKAFALNSGLLVDEDVLATIQKIEAAGGHASMIMLGNAVFSDIPFPGADELTISYTPARVV